MNNAELLINEDIINDFQRCAAENRARFDSFNNGLAIVELGRIGHDIGEKLSVEPLK